MASAGENEDEEEHQALLLEKLSFHYVLVEMWAWNINRVYNRLCMVIRKKFIVCYDRYFLYVTRAWDNPLYGCTEP